ncbi:unnamed protein product [Brassicogethes aeneus]|uniref:DE-cadherin n=1 Tax=Brassicogethes aeneus TaxID=1431903 RepID=A0A9P0FPD3_BRAAE|nr:unnamed protein product [Brassicogethes aeneus]
MKLYYLFSIWFLLVTFCYAQSGQERDKNLKPRFTHCSTYNVSIKEEQGRIPVVKVKAEDNDPPEAGGTITYKLVQRDGERQYFQIDNVTGQITTLLPFDRDEPTRQKEIYITVQATDNGRPALADICTIRVTITDINDNDPSFDSIEYMPNVAEDARVGSTVAKIFAYDIDDGDNSRLTYSINDRGSFSEYFKIDKDTGVLTLNKSLVGMRDSEPFRSNIEVHDNGVDPKRSEVPISVKVVGSDKRLPMILTRQDGNVKVLPENFNNYDEPLFEINAQSNIDDKEVVFELIKGKTAQTNKDQTFILTPDNDNENAVIKLGRPLDYELVTEYTLTVRVKNKDQMEATATFLITVTDVNDEIPAFIDIIKGSVIENEHAGQKAMQVRGLDKDGTSENNIVKYSIEGEGSDKFEIDPDSGAIKSLVVFDREEINLYHIKIKAYDNSPSALTKIGEPNSVIQQFQIIVEDRNDNKPKFTQAYYRFDLISESTDVGKDVGEVKADDKDAASLIKYSIIKGDDDHHFYIEDTTGRIKVYAKLDYEKTEKYELVVRAHDGIYEDETNVIINIKDENDELPQFEDFDKTITLEEETPYTDCIITVKAYDPDIKDRSADQHIVYDVQNSKNFIDVDQYGCVKLKKPLDRDPPNGAETRQVFIHAYDNDGHLPYQTNFTELLIILKDVNDNAPYLNVSEVIWYENEDPGQITVLSADDNDSNENGPPFVFEIEDSASDEITGKFGMENGKILVAKVFFDREEKKFYDIPIKIMDSGEPTQTSHNNILRVVIGDKNDNKAKDGESEIFVYKYEEFKQDIAIGRVYVNDPDDWDLNDKTFLLTDGDQSSFYLSQTDHSMIIMKSTTSEGAYDLEFQVTETHEPIISTHTVTGKVHVIVKALPKEAVQKSGSIRLNHTTIEGFIDKENGMKSKKDILQFEIARILNTSRENVDVFTVLNSGKELVDVRFSAHGSPYYYPEKLNNIATSNQKDLETKLNVDFEMISINECVNISVCPGKDCVSRLAIKEEPAVVFTNKTSFVGVKAITEALCDTCERPNKECLNGGTSIDNDVCSCPPGFEGPHCEVLGIGFTGYGTATYEPFDSCNNTEILMWITPQSDNGLIFYQGPLVASQSKLSKDFISLELEKNNLYLKLNLGDEVIQVRSDKALNDGSSHKIRIRLTSNDVELEIDDCKSNCIKLNVIKSQRLLRTNGPLQLGGLKFRFQEEAKTIWSDPPVMNDQFAGCIKNLSYNGYLYNLGQPSDHKQAISDCNYLMKQAVTLGRDSLVAILVCIGVMIILMLALVVYRRKQDNLLEKDMDDTRENIINYEDEGGGECDTNYDLTVFRNDLDEKHMLPDVPADISMFLNTKKGSCDKDPDNLPYDDVRHYAYEGDGNSTGSLSSLASCTDDGDLNFSHLSSFGPRFRKLANIYGEDEDDEESENGHEESWC